MTATPTTSTIPSGGSQAPPNLGPAQNAICSVYNTVESVIFILGLTLIVLGGAVYAGSHLLPGQTRGQVQGYAMGMLIGGVIGVSIAVAAPWVIQVITNCSVSAITA
ncbi:MAG: hypothetical protein ACP5K5_03875, partial [Candidatus Micrarchaeia archaeon]